MDLVTFLLLSLINVLVICVVIYWRSPLSSEGWCAVFLLGIVLSDNIELIGRYFFAPDSLLLGTGELSLRIYPTIIHIAGISALIAGLLIVDPRPRPVSVALGTLGLRSLRHIGIALVLIGAALYGVAIALIGAFNADHFLFALNDYRSSLTDLPFGGFWYRGVDIGLLGLTILVATSKGTSRVLYATAAILTPIIATGNKGGLEKALFFFLFVFGIYRPVTFKRFLGKRSTWIVLAPATVVSVLLIVGVKNHFIKGQVNPTSSAEVLQSGLNSIRTRYSSDGLFRGYSVMVSTLHDGYIQLFKGRVLRYTATDWIPRMIYPGKPDHPFRAIGYMVYSDRHVYANDHSAPTLVGWAYSDAGHWSAILYLLMGGVLLGFIRKIVLRPGRSLYWSVGYLFFCLFGGCSPEAGFLDLIWCSAFAIALMLAVSVIVSIIGAGELRWTATRTLARSWVDTESGVPAARYGQ